MVKPVFPNIIFCKEPLHFFYFSILIWLLCLHEVINYKKTIGYVKCDDHEGYRKKRLWPALRQILQG
jgi:hypothetical protein